MSDQLALLPEYLTAHLQLTLVALLLGIGLSVPLGVAATRIRWLEQPILGVASIIQTMPGLALLAIMVPLLAALNLRSIGFLPAIIALFLYSVLPILRNTVAGIGSVDPAYIEAAQGVGMTRSQQLWKVELPLSLPVIVAGIRTSTVWTVGMATLSTPVGAPSLGNYIFTGLQTRNYTAVMVGCISAALLALSLDSLVRGLEVGVRRRSRTLITAVLAVFLALYGYSGLTMAQQFWDGSAPIRMGAKTFTEQYILSEVLARQIETRTGNRVEIIPSLGSTVAFDALASGEIDVYVDYSGTIWATIMKRDEVPKERKEVLQETERFLAERHDVTLVGALGFENTYAFGMRRRQALELGIRTIGDLGAFAGRMSIGGDYEFFGRPEWDAVKSAYGLDFADQRSMDSSLMYQAVASGEVDVITAFSTDGRIEAFEISLLEDDRQVIPPYDAVILTNHRLVRDQPDVVDALRELSGKVSAVRMRRMNLAVDQSGLSPAKVAEEFCRELRGLEQ